MKIQQILQKCLTDWKNISQIDFCLLDSDNHIFLSTCDKKLPAESKLEEFRQSSALCVPIQAAACIRSWRTIPSPIF
mgnify:CR=1 FL=1